MKEERERTPLRIILQNFINHVENLEAYQKENSYEKEFQDLKLFSENLKTVGDYSCKEGEKEINRKKNRYKDILPFDYTRVTLSEYVGVPGSDYINANYIKGASGSPAYIASQGPLPHTVNDFWRMVVECEVQVIVMACNEEESGKHKCENYWVEKEGEEKKFGMATIRLLKASTICPDFLVRTMQLKYMNAESIPEERVVCQFHYGAWPDHGVPAVVRPLLEMVRLVRDTQASETLPVLIHCSAGCGRTGTICAIDYVWGLLRAGKLKLDFSLFQLVRDMRKQRIAMVQTKDQYILVHQAVKELFQDQLRMIHSHPYENIDISGHPIVPSRTSKAAIFYPGKTTMSEEKQDEKEKESGVILNSVSTANATALTSSSATSDAPPLPHKKRIHIVSSKQEKEVENLTQRQLSIASASGNTKLPSQSALENLVVAEDQEVVEKNIKKISAKPPPPPIPLDISSKVPGDPTHGFHQPPSTSTKTEVFNEVPKPSIAKLKALFESNTSVKEPRPSNAGQMELKPRLSQQVTRSHSLGAVRKPQKFTQFNAGAHEAGMRLPMSADLCDSERYKSASNTHVDMSCSSYKGVETGVNAPALKLETPVSLSCNVPVSCHDNVPRYETKSGSKSSSAPLVVRKPLTSSAVLVTTFQHESPSHTTDVLSGTHTFPEAPRPALPVKRSKSLKAKMSGEAFKLSLSKRDHGQSQELPTTEHFSKLSPHVFPEGKPEVQFVSKVREYDGLSQSDKTSTSSTCKVPGKPLAVQSSARIEPKDPSVSISQRSDRNDSFPGKVSISCAAVDLKVGHLSPHSMKKSNINSEHLPVNVETKKGGEYVSKPNCDVCRAQSLNLKREKSGHTFSAFSQESQYVNVKKFGVNESAKHCKEPLHFKVVPNNTGDSKDPVQPRSSIPVDTSGVYEHCSNYLLAEGVEKPMTTESQRIAAANARHKVDTVVGGLGIRERRNSFRRAVGQGIDEKSSGTVATNKKSKWPPSNPEPYISPHSEGVSFKKQSDHKSSNSAKRHESEETLPFDPPLRDSSERNRSVECNVIFKNPPGIQKFPVMSECKYKKSVQKQSENYGEVIDVQKLNKLPRMTETSPISSDIEQKTVRSAKKTVGDSNALHKSSPLWKQSVGSDDKKAALNLVKHNSNPNGSNVLFNPSKSSAAKEAHLWPPQKIDSVPLNKGNLIDAGHAIEKLGPQPNPNLIVPSEVDVDQVGASMRHSFQDKNEGIKVTGTPESSNHGNSAASTHFTRALEVIHQTAASIRTKFSWSAGSGGNSPKSSDPSPKTSPVATSPPPVSKTHQNGCHRRGERNLLTVSNQPKVLKKQQQYL